MMVKCPKCGKEFDDALTTCPDCGTAVDKSSQQPTDRPEETTAEQSVQTEPIAEHPEEDEQDAGSQAPAKKSGLWKGIVIAAVVVILAVVIYQVHLERQRKATYDQAVALLESEEYDQAEELFLTIPNYKDTADYLQVIENQRSYEEAVSLFEAEQYDEAEAVFNTIQDYKDAADYLEQIATIRAYNEAYALYEQGEYEDALQIIDGITVYEPAAQLKQTMESELEYNAYLAAQRSYALLTQTGSLEAQRLLSQVSLIWYNSIYKVTDAATDLYTKDAAGEFRTDFNTALAAYYVSEAYAEQETRIEELRAQIEEQYALVEAAPAGLEEMAVQAQQVQDAYTALTELALSPTGSFTSFAEKTEQAAAYFTEQAAQLKAMTPQMLTMNRDAAVNEDLTDKQVSILGYQLQEAAAPESGDETGAAAAEIYEAFLADYVQSGDVDESMILDTLTYIGTADDPYAVVVLRTEPENEAAAEALSDAFVQYAVENDLQEVIADDSQVLLESSEGVTVLYVSPDAEAAGEILTAAGFEDVQIAGLDGAAEDDGPEPFEAVSEAEEGFTESLSEDTYGETVFEQAGMGDIEEAASEAEEADTEAMNLVPDDEAEAVSETVSEAVSETADTSDETANEAVAEYAEMPEMAEETAAEETEQVTETTEAVSEAIDTLNEATEALSEAIERVSEAQEALSEAVSAMDEARETVTEGDATEAEESVAELTGLEETAESEEAEEAATEAAEPEEDAEETVTEEFEAVSEAVETVTEAADIETEESVAELIGLGETVEDVAEVETEEAEEQEAVSEAAEVVTEAGAVDAEEAVTEEAEELEAVSEAAEEDESEEIEEAVTEEDETADEADLSVQEWSGRPVVPEGNSEKPTEDLSELFSEISTEKPAARPTFNKSLLGVSLVIMNWLCR